MKTCKSCKCEYDPKCSSALGLQKRFCSEECYSAWSDPVDATDDLVPTREEEYLLAHSKCTPEQREKILRQHRKSACGRFSLRGANKYESKFIRGNCKCWDCSRCGPKKAGRYKHSIRKNAERLRLQRFLTLTLDPKKLPKGTDPVEYLRISFNKLRTYLCRKFGEKISYICVLEFQKAKGNNP